MLTAIKRFMQQRRALALCRSRYHYAKTPLGKWAAIIVAGNDTSKSHVEICEFCKCGYVVIWKEKK